MWWFDNESAGHFFFGECSHDQLNVWMHHQSQLNSKSPEANRCDLSRPLNVNRAGFFSAFRLYLSIYPFIYYSVCFFFIFWWFGQQCQTRSFCSIGIDANVDWVNAASITAVNHQITSSDYRIDLWWLGSSG